MSLSLDIDLGLGELFREPAECIISVDDEPIDSLYPYLRELSVELTRGSPAVCTLLFDSVRDESGQWSVQDSGIFLPWRRIKIEAAWGSRVEEIMRGYIKEVTPDYPNDMGSAAVTVTGQDETLVLDRSHVEVAWSTEDNPRSDGDIVTEIAQRVGLAADADTGLENQALNQDDTDIRFLTARAEANGFELFTREGTLYFKSINLDSAPQPPIRVYAGRSTNCLSFSPQYDGHKPDQVRMTRAAEEGEEVEEETLIPDLTLLGNSAASSEGMGLDTFSWKLEQPAGATLEEARARAQAAANENAWKITATGELDGSLYGHVLLTHQLVAVDGVGDTYGGLYYVDHVRHQFSSNGYRQSFRLLRNALGGEGDVAAGL